MTSLHCLACGSAAVEDFHHQSGVPTNSCLLLPDIDEAANFPTGDIDLAFCTECGFIQNRSFLPELAEYSARYEETQAFSSKFVEFARGLARSWIERHGLEGGRVVEIGCGKGEFLTYMAEAGIGSGIGIDPGVDPSRVDSSQSHRLSWVKGMFDEGYGPLDADAVVCRHTLEHVADVRSFLTRIRESIGERDTVVLFELPDAMRVLEEAAFWDVYYEHCSYFSEGSLVRLFERCGFEVLDVALAYDDQYLLLEARPARDTTVSVAVDDLPRLRKGVEYFASAYIDLVGKWRTRLEEVESGGGKTVIWGASSKGVSFLGAVDSGVTAAVDINPYKQGMYMAGTGHPIVAPDELVEISPDLVVVMNPIYLEEIRTDLDRIGVGTEVTAV